MIISQIVAGRLASLAMLGLYLVLAPAAASAATVSLVCGFHYDSGDGSENANTRSNESRILIDLKKGTVAFTSPGSGQLLVPNTASISKNYIRWTYGITGKQTSNYSISRVNGEYAVRYVFGGDDRGGSRGSCLPKGRF